MTTLISVLDQSLLYQDFTTSVENVTLSWWQQPTEPFIKYIGKRRRSALKGKCTLAKFSPNSIMSLAAFYSVNDNVNHVVVALSNGQLQEFWFPP